MGTFLADAVGLIQQLVEDLGGLERVDERAVELAAHLYAVAYRLPHETGSAPLATPPRGLAQIADLDDVAARLRGLTPEVDARDLYWTLVSCLQAIDQALARLPASRFALPASTPLRSRGECKLFGEVRHWLRPKPALATLRKDRRELAASGPPEPAPHPADHLERLGMVWNAHPGWPRVEVGPALATYPALLTESGRLAAGDGGFRVALCPLVPAAHPLFRVTADGCYFRAFGPDALHNRGALLAHLDRVLAAAAEQSVRLVVLPELMVDRETRRHLAERVRRSASAGRGRRAAPLGIVAGSFHVWPADADPDEAPPLNESRLLDSAGRVLLRHQKRGRFRVTPSQVRDWSHLFPEPPARFPDDVREVVEHIVHGPVLEVLETSLGRVVIAICADCITADHTSLEPLLRDLRPDVLLLVSMTHETTVFEELMNRLALSEISTLFVNARSVCQPEKGQVLSAARLALYEPRGAPPTRVRLLCGAAEPEVRYFNPADLVPGNGDPGTEEAKREKEQKRGWRALSRAPAGPTGVAWLGDAAEPLGLVVDLGAHWAWADDA